MKQQIGIRVVTTAVMTVALTIGAAGVALAQNRPELTWRQQANRATHALNLLEDRGFTQFSNFQATGQDFTADVIKHGKTMQVTIDPDTNQILHGGSAAV